MYAWQHVLYTECSFSHDVMCFFKGTIHLLEFPPFFTQETFFDFLFAFLHTETLLKRIFYKGAEFAPNRAKFFPFTVVSFQKGSKTILTCCILRG